jgi:glyoxylase-like metal-dependent hydrolase (beta-lactamase superfamily II)
MGPQSVREINKIKVFEMADGSTFNIGGVTIKVIHTPGHTLESSCFLLIDSKGK